MSLEITVNSATSLPNLESLGKIDPYVSIEYQGFNKKTAVVKSELNPVWNETVVFDLKGQPVREQDELKFFVKDWERVGRNRLVGTCTVPMSNILRSLGAKLDVALTDANQRTLGALLSFSVQYKPPPGADAGLPDSGGQIVAATAETTAAVEGEEQTDEVDGGAGTQPTAGGGVGGPAAAAVRKRTVVRKAAGSKSRGNLSTKAQDFQLRVRVVEGRQIQGNNISPVCRLTVRRQIKQTNVCSSTNSPVWNKNFTFNFNTSPAEIVDDIITFEVFNAHKLRSDALIGSFKCDVGIIYDGPQHSLINKWVLLSLPDDSQAGATGYLKICAALLGPGDEAPTWTTASKQTDEEDIESNLLRPAGIQLRPATFKLKLYRAEDLPRMDSDFMQGVKRVFGSDDKKEFVDPYLIFSFAGSKVCSKILYNCDHPEWNQELKLGLHFPSMCEKLKLQLMDWDRMTTHDHIATDYIDITKTSQRGSDESEEDGFLPTFGPCFVNLYGAPREYSDLPTEHDDLNKGKGVGVAYRGRVLVELETIIGELPPKPVDDITNEDILRVQKYLRRRKFRLHTAFLNASMITSIDAPVEFEVSIGNYGNKLDELLPPCVSTTQPTNAVFDGCHYYFLPWADSKPCVAVDCQWEDVTFRLEAVNLLLGITDRLESNLEKLRIGRKANLPIEEQAQILIYLLDQLVNDCRKPLPTVTPSVHVDNDLDRNLYSYRQVELLKIASEAATLRESATDVADALTKITDFISTLHSLTVEPQCSIPDVFIWMIAGGKRIAYYRCPANLVLWSANSDYRGKFCGKLETISLKFPGSKAEQENHWNIPALLRVKIWLGLEQNETNWHRMQSEGDLAVFAETYENQVSILGNWTNKGPTMSRPKWSDATGKIELSKDDFHLPPGWRWDTDWYISPELSMLFDKDAGHQSFVEDIYECQSRLPGTNWGPASVSWADVKGDATVARNEVELPGGWQWKEDWQVDLNRAVDEYGWEYTVEATFGGYGPVEKTYHMCRRRRWLRLRQLVQQVKPAERVEKVKKVAETEGWEYAPLFTMKFHFKERRMDLVRRRRWHRKMVADTTDVESGGTGTSCVFQIASKKGKGDDEEQTQESTAPRMFLVCKKPSLYQLRAYIYQARDLRAGDNTGLSDPFARVVFMNQSQATEKLEKTICPTWDQSLIFETVEIHGDPQLTAEKPPKVIIEIFDHDSFGSSEFLGRTEAIPTVRLDSSKSLPPVLQWFPLRKGSTECGELLAAFELFLIDGRELPFQPPKRGKLFMVPNGIRPLLKRTAIEVMCWGVRNMRKFQLASVVSPNVEIEVGGQLVKSKIIRNASRNPNFDEPLLFFDIMLPCVELYTPPINICVKDNRQFGRKPVVGIHSIKSLQVYRKQLPVEDRTSSGQEPASSGIDGDSVSQRSSSCVIDITPAISKAQSTVSLVSHHDEDIDWWSKYYASVGRLDKCRQYVELGYDTIQVYNTELEKVPEFQRFTDFCRTFKLSRGKNADEEETSVAGEFKGHFCVYQLPDDPSVPLPQHVLHNLPPNAPIDCLIRVYVIRAFDLQPSDPNGLADPYIQLRLGKLRMDTCGEYVPNTLNPVFGKMFEMKATFPMATDLRIRIKDFDLTSPNDMIGETVIDLENRFLSRHCGLVGLPKTYCVSGVCEWRNSRKPTQLLEEFCTQHLGVSPVFRGTHVLTVGQRIYKLADFEQKKPLHTHLGPADERLALHVLNTLPVSVGVPLVSEHIETRPLYNRLLPGIEQGKVQMWVDIFPISLGPPGPAVNINPRVPKKYELRIVVWNTKDVVLEETSITGEKMSDIYVKGWINGTDDLQETDVHYRSLDGEGNFNWRFVFPFDYLPEEQNLVIRKKEKFWSLDQTELKFPPVLVMQIWDNDKFSSDDFLGSFELNLNQLPMPAKTAKSCSLDMLPSIGKTTASSSRPDVKLVSLFDQKRLRGFWPCGGCDNNQQKLTGKIEMELELVCEGEISERPVARARDEPNQHPTLEPPKRPETSFLWFTSPWKTFKLIVWRRYRVHFLMAFIFLLVVIFVILFVYAIPAAAVNKIFGSSPS